MAPTTTALLSEIANDPASLGYAAPRAANDDHAVAALLNAPTASRSKQVPRVPIAAVLMWAAGGPLYDLYAGSVNTLAFRAATRPPTAPTMTGVPNFIVTLSYAADRDGMTTALQGVWPITSSW
jgi:hypothetical protein